MDGLIIILSICLLLFVILAFFADERQARRAIKRYQDELNNRTKED